MTNSMQGCLMKDYKYFFGGLMILLLLLGSYASALTLPEAKQIASTQESGDTVLQWSPSNPWPGALITRSDGTTIWMETNFWNIAGGDGENYMRFIKATDEVVFYVNMTNVQTNWGGNAFATPNVIIVGRTPAIWWGDKPVVGGYGWFSLPLNGANIDSISNVWTRVNFEIAKGQGTLARTGIIMWFEQPNGNPLGEVYIAFSDDYGGIVNTQYPPTNIGTLTEKVYVNGQVMEITFTIQRTWNWDHFVLEFIPDQPIPEGDVIIDVKPFAKAAVQGIVDDPWSDWTADQITWTSIGFGTYVGSNGNAFEIGWILHDAELLESIFTLEKAKQIASTANPGDTVLQWAPGWYWAPPYDDNGVIRQICTWPGVLITRSDNTTIWMEPNFWNIVSGDGENYMRFIKATDEVAFYVNMTNVQTQWGGIAWATPAVVIAGRVPPSLTGTELPAAGGYKNFSLPMPAVNVSNYESIWAKVDFELVKREDTLIRAGLVMWFEDTNGKQLAEVYVPFFDDYNGIVGAQFPPIEVGSVSTTVYVNGVARNVTFTVQKAWNWNNFAFEFIPEEPIAKSSGEISIDLGAIVDKVIQEIVNDPNSNYNEEDIVWSSLAFGTYSGSQGNSFEYGWILHDARVLPQEAVKEEEISPEETPSHKLYDVTYISTLSYFYYYRYHKLMKAYEEILEENITVAENIINTTEILRKQAEENYQKAIELSYGGIRTFIYLRKAYVYIKNAKETLEGALQYPKLVQEYEKALEQAKMQKVSEKILNDVETAKSISEDYYNKALSLPAGDPNIVFYISEAYRLLNYAVKTLKDNILPTPLLEIRDVAASVEEGDVQFTWWDQWLEEPIQLSDGRTVWMQTNFWNIVGGEGEVFMRFIKQTEDFAFYVDLNNVQTQWGGIAWATPEVIFAGRAPKTWWGNKPAVGGYGFFDLPLPASDVSNYDRIWVKANYEVVKKEGSLVRFGLLLWFENADGWPVAEVYIPFFDDFGGLVGVDGKITIGQVDTVVVLNGNVSSVTFKGERGWNPGGWWSFEFLPEQEFPSSGEIVIDIKPIVDKVLAELGTQDVTWTSISLGSYSGSREDSFNYGWIIRDVKLLSPEEAPLLD
ncbi:hypothetical protein [Pyrococcus woesei]|uniref:hypothetical protein n=1 Tax=Pyrococcus woesei TaxID=2262 RepID=UPI003D2EAB1E